MSNTQEQRESRIKSIIGQVSREAYAVLAEAELSEDVRTQIQSELMADTSRVLDSLTLAELQSELALERYIESSLDLRMKIHQKQFDERKK